MRVCLTCGAASDAATCPGCGEASWGALVADEPAPQVVHVEPPKPQQQPRKHQGNRR